MEVCHDDDIHAGNVKSLARSGGATAEIIDPETRQRYVLLKADVFDRIHLLLQGGPLSKEEQKFLLEQAGRRAGWDDPEMDIYDDLLPAVKLNSGPRMPHRPLHHPAGDVTLAEIQKPLPPRSSYTRWPSRSRLRTRAFGSRWYSDGQLDRKRRSRGQPTPDGLLCAQLPVDRRPEHAAGCAARRTRPSSSGWNDAPLA